MLTATLLERGEIVTRTFRNGNDLWLYQQETECYVIRQENRPGGSAPDTQEGASSPFPEGSASTAPYPADNGTVDAHDSATWTILDDPLDSGRRIVTSWSPQRFCSGFGPGGDPLHFQTVIVEADGSLGASWEYACESEARVGHHRIVTDLILQERR